MFLLAVSQLLMENSAHPTDCFPSMLLHGHTQAKDAGLRHSPNHQQTHFQFDKMSEFSSHSGLYFLDTSQLLTNPFHCGLITAFVNRKDTGEFQEASVFLNMSTLAPSSQGYGFSSGPVWM